jgi:mRNA-degrading endonuclease RelE of RelBE toxin-antitoxin system
MYRVEIHKDAEKAMQKAPEYIREKAFRFLRHLRHDGTRNPPCRIKALQGPFKKHHFLEAIIDKDYRIIFRKEDDTFYIRLAGTHNELHTG